MSRSFETTDFTKLIADTAAARRAGVFERTELDISALLACVDESQVHESQVGESDVDEARIDQSRVDRSKVDRSRVGEGSGSHSPRLVRVYERIMVGLPLAACLGLAIGLVSLASRSPEMSGNQFAMLGSNGAVDSSGALCDVRTMYQCLSGPGRGVSPECGAADLDSDGDVDMFDIGSFQRLASIHQ